MSYSNNRFTAGSNFGPQLGQFVPFCQQAGQMFNFPTPFPLHQLPTSLFPTSLLIQQQNNYFNSTLAPHSLFPRSGPSPLLPHSLHPYPAWPVRPNPPKTQVLQANKAKKMPEVICLDEESEDNVLVIEDSTPERVAPLELKKQEKVQPKVQRSEPKLSGEKQIKQRAFFHEAKKVEVELLEKRQNRVAKYPPQNDIEKKAEAKVSKRKPIFKDKFQYKLTSHEKHLSQLSDYRQFFPHEIATGPQFQAQLPHLQLFRCSFSTTTENADWLRVRREKLLRRLQGAQLK